MTAPDPLAGVDACLHRLAAIAPGHPALWDLHRDVADALARYRGLSDGGLSPLMHCMGCKGYTPDWEHECEGLPASRLDSAFAVFAAQARAGWNADGPGVPLHRELRDSEGYASKDYGSYWTEWYCEPPPGSAAYRVRHEEWDEAGEDGYPVRRIYVIEVRDAAQGQAEEGLPGS